MLVGTGAFDAVEAERNVNIETAADADAFLGLEPARDDDAYVDTTEDGLIEVNLDGNEEGGEGLNQRAVTRFENLVRVTNNGTQDVESLEIMLEPEDGDFDGDMEGTFSIIASDGSDDNPFDIKLVLDDGVFKIIIILTDDADDGEDPNLVSDELLEEESLEPGEDIDFGLEIDLIEGGDEDDDLPEEDYVMTIGAHTAENN